MIREEVTIKQERLNNNLYKVVFKEILRKDDKYQVQYKIIKTTKEGVKSIIYINDYIISDKKMIKRKIMSMFHKLMTGLKGEDYYDIKITL